MNRGRRKTVLLFLGLPYTGKTALIHRLLEALPGEPVYVDGIFRDLVPENEICLDRWLAEGPRFIERILAIVDASRRSRVYVELGIMQKEHRTRLIGLLEQRPLRVVPVVLSCTSRDALRRRVAERQRALASGPDKLKIAIGPEELFERIHAVFHEPSDDEGFHVIDTSGPIEESLDAVIRLAGGLEVQRLPREAPRGINLG